jgi:hypothetical protein
MDGRRERTFAAQGHAARACLAKTRSASRVEAVANGERRGVAAGRRAAPPLRVARRRLTTPAALRVEIVSRAPHRRSARRQTPVPAPCFRGAMTAGAGIVRRRTAHRSRMARHIRWPSRALDRAGSRFGDGQDLRGAVPSCDPGGGQHRTDRIGCLVLSIPTPPPQPGGFRRKPETSAHPRLQGPARNYPPPRQIAHTDGNTRRRPARYTFVPPPYSSRHRVLPQSVALPTTAESPRGRL